MEISINTPALLFPAITLMMLAYTNRFLGLAALIRKLHGHYKEQEGDRNLIKQQIINLRKRLSLIKQMQSSAVLSFFFCILSMLFIYLKHAVWSYSIFALSLILLMFSLVISLREILISTRALEIELGDMDK